MKHPYLEDLFHCSFDDVIHNLMLWHYSTRRNQMIFSLRYSILTKFKTRTLAVDGPLLSRILVSNMILFYRKCFVAVFYYSWIRSYKQGHHYFLSFFSLHLRYHLMGLNPTYNRRKKYIDSCLRKKKSFFFSFFCCFLEIYKYLIELRRIEFMIINIHLFCFL